ncbi:MAG: hypothetical protein MR607_00545 [Lachnospiraceae bacterium]|nr:hypothetical protein [Lachnospiraceae bacterium]
MRKRLYHEGFRYQKGLKGLPDKPDIVLTKYKIYIDPIWELRCSQGSGCLYKDVRIVKETIFDNQVSDE